MPQSSLSKYGAALAAGGALAFSGVLSACGNASSTHPSEAAKQPQKAVQAQPAPQQMAPPAPPPPPAPKTALGADESYQYGDIQVSATGSGGRVTAVQMAKWKMDGEKTSADIEGKAVPQLIQEATQAGNANIQGVSGATYTSNAFKQSLAAAVAQLG